MPVTFVIPAYLRAYTGGRGQVGVDLPAKSVGEALEGLWKAYPGARDRVVTELGEVRQHLNIFVGNENIRYTGGLATKITDGCEIMIIPSVSGGG